MRHFDKWKSETILQAKAHDVYDVFKPEFVPMSEAKTKMFKYKQDFVMSVFAKTLLFDQGKDMMHRNADAGTAQLVWTELLDFAKTSTAA
jgi:hypothetical protein